MLKSFSTIPLALAAALLLPACAASPDSPEAPQSAEQSLLQSATPGPGATVQGPVNQLQLRFSRPVRLDEVTITGSDGTTMPMMVTAAGANANYSIPVSGLGTGTYTVAWRASVDGVPQQGSYRFTVR